MTATFLTGPGVVWWSERRSRRLLAAALLPFLAVGALLTGAGAEEPPQPVWIVGPLAIAIGALQLRHSLACARGERPRAWPLTLTALAILIYAPLPQFQWDWASIQWMFIASAAMLLRGRIRWALIIAPIVATVVWAMLDAETPLEALYVAFYWLVGLTGGSACLYGAVQLVRAVDDLFATRAELAEISLGQERLRVSRDLHDLLGQSLSAVSLKGDLALALLRSGTQAAAAGEIRDLTQVARDTLRDVRHVVRSQLPVSFQSETNRAAALLTAASIDARLETDLSDLTPAVDELFGWAIREGVTNMLRHSQASACSISATRRGEMAQLKILNDGAGETASEGTGIVGLAERAHALSGTVEAGRRRGGWFQLHVEVSEGSS